MVKKNNCPNPVDLMAYADGELHDNNIVQHLLDCPQCQSIITIMKQESLILWETLEGLAPVGDLCARVQDQISVRTSANQFYTVLWYIFIASSLFVFGLAGYFLPAFITFDSWTLAGIKIYKYFTSTAFTTYQMLEYLSPRALGGGPVLPALTIVLAVLVVNFIYKGRLSNV